MPAIITTAASATRAYDLGGASGVEYATTESSGIASLSPKAQKQLDFAHALRGEGEGGGIEAHEERVRQILTTLPPTTQTQEDVEQGSGWMNAAKQQDGQPQHHDLQSPSQSVQVSSDNVGSTSSAEEVGKPSRVRRSAENWKGQDSYDMQRADFEKKKSELKALSDRIKNKGSIHPQTWKDWAWLNNDSDKVMFFNSHKYKSEGVNPRDSFHFKDEFGYTHTENRIAIKPHNWEYVPDDFVLVKKNGYLQGDGFFSIGPQYADLRVSPSDTYLLEDGIDGSIFTFKIRIPKKALNKFVLETKNIPNYDYAYRESVFDQYFGNNYRIKVGDQRPQAIVSVDDGNGNFEIEFESSENVGNAEWGERRAKIPISFIRIIRH